MRINVRFVPLLGLTVGVFSALVGPGGNAAAPGLNLGSRMNALTTNFKANWPWIFGAPIGAALGSSVARGFGNPGVTVGPLSFKAF